MFQYVSIISASPSLLHLTLSPFTFQYVSIISELTEEAKSGWVHIYIPICFYYFRVSAGNDNEKEIRFTFQYVSIISLQEILKARGYYKFTFQYVSIISRQTKEASNEAEAIYIPICFYYFEEIALDGLWMYD